MTSLLKSLTFQKPLSLLRLKVAKIPSELSCGVVLRTLSTKLLKDLYEKTAASEIKRRRHCPSSFQIK